MTSPAAPLPSSQPVARLTTPAEIVAAVPQLCGFVPHESLVLLSLHGRRPRLGLTMRVDLPPPALERQLVASLVGRLRADGARRAVAVVHTEAPDDGELPGSTLVGELRRALGAARIEVGDLLLARAGRWWSYDCAGCCPPDGTPLQVAPTPALTLVAAARALDGRAVLPSREDLVASLSAPPDAGLAARLDETRAARDRRVAAEGRVPVGREALRLWRRAVDRVLEPDGAPGPGTAAALVVSLSDVLVRDEVLSWALTDDAALLALLLRLAAASTPPHDVPVCTLVGWLAHLRGDGALANVALDRALAGDPACAMARLCREALDAQVAPSAVRSLLAEARTVLHQQHPWTAPVG